jgi:hypothetical protein
MKKFLHFPFLIFVLSILFIFKPFFVDSKVPIPADTIIGLYHPFRDLYAKDYPNGIPYKNFLITDPVRQQYPWRFLAVEQVKKWELPLWNPYSMAGTPLLGSVQAAVFYPFNIFFLMLPFSFAWSLLIILQPMLAGGFLYFYLRSLGMYRVSSLFGGFVFAFCGFSVAWMEWGTVLHVGLWLPLILLTMDKLFFHIHFLNLERKKFSYVWSLIFVLALSASFFAGHLQIFFYVFLVSFIYFFVRWLQYGAPIKFLVWYVLLISSFLLVTFIQWFPTVQLIAESARDIDQINWQQTEGWFIPWHHLIQFVAPDFFGNPATLNYWGTWNYGELTGYIGIVPFVMALYALFFRHERKTFFFAAVLITSLIFALPTFFAKIPYLLHLPFFSTSQPTRLLFLADFSLSILAAFGIDWYIRQKKKSYIIFPMVSLGVILAELWLFVMLNPGDDMLVAQRNLYFPTILFVFTFLIVLINIFIKNKKIFFVLLGVLLLISFVDLLRFGQKFTPFTKSEYLFPQTKTLSYLQNDKEQFRIMATDQRILPPNFAVMYRLQSVDGYDPLYLRRYGELIAASERGRPDIHPPFGFNRIITPENINSPIINLLGVKYVMSFSELPEPQFTKVTEEGLTQVYKNNNAYPRAFFVTNVKYVKDKQEAINALFDKSIDLRTTAIVEDQKGPTRFTNGNVIMAEYLENHIILHTNNQQEGFLVLTDTFYPTWHAKVCSDDGSNCQEREIYLTNYNFRGIIVPGGNHRIVFYNSLL